MAFNSVQSTINWASPFLRNYPLSNATNNEPALTSVNMVIETCLSAPFAWEWNRKVATVTTASGTQDYAVTIADYGYLEKITLKDSSNVAYDVQTLRPLLAKGATDSASLALPTIGAAQLDSNDGSTAITFRFQPVPDAIYTGEIIYQKAPATISDLTGTWTPIPNKYSLIYNYGFLAMMYLFIDDPRWTAAIPRFLSSLVGISSGLSAEQKSVFLGDWLQSHLSGEQLDTLAKQGAAANQVPMLGIGSR